MKLTPAGYEAPLAGGGRAVLTLVPPLQAAAEALFDDNDVPYGAAVVLSVSDGKVLALAGRSAYDPRLGPADLALTAWAPAASIFKVVSAAALVAEAGLSANSTICYHGGASDVVASNLRDVPSLDTSCHSLGYAVAKSQNAIIAKMVSRHLTPAALERVAGAFGFGVGIPFAAPVGASTLDIPRDKLEYARMSAGFYHSTLSPLHGALVAATIANQGLMPRPVIVEAAFDQAGKPLPVPGRRARRVLDPKVAAEVGRMMELTTAMGTGKSSFVDGRGRAFLPFAVAGKTGSLNFREGRNLNPPAGGLDAGNYLAYSWFVGYAPADRPEVAFAVLLGNPARWKVKATYVARRLLESKHGLDRAPAAPPRARPSVGMVATAPAPAAATPR
jgi:cell division protein FtsI/penicillin-binding protein 2